MTKAEKIAAAKAELLRELAFRSIVYYGLIRSGKMTPEDAKRHIDHLGYALEIVREAERAEVQPDIFDGGP